ncbi:MAG: glycosyl hydrolase [Flavisolibacter sp.]
MSRKTILFILLLIPGLFSTAKAQSGFVQRSGDQFVLNGKPYYYIGANYWYGGVMGLLPDRKRGYERLRQELDFLASKGVRNIRVMAAAEGEGLVNGVPRVQPPVQTAKGIFNESVLKGLDILLSELDKRNMKAVLFLSNNWEWSGGFLQYLRWNGLIDEATFRRKLSWDEMRDYVSKFYSCTPCKSDYLAQVKVLMDRTNSITGKKYTDETSIMAWELANEPRPMRPAAVADYKKWIADVAAFIKSKDKNHLVTTGAEGEMGTETIDVFKAIHADKNIDYATIHIWPKNWSWFKPATMSQDFSAVQQKTSDYIRKHLAIANELNMPLVVEEFGIPRDGHSFDMASTTKLRDSYYQNIFQALQNSYATNAALAGVNFWAFNGMARPVAGQVFWKEGDDYMGDPPMEEQGLNGVFDNDTSTWNLVYGYTSALGKDKIVNLPSDRQATKQTVALYQNLEKLLDKGIMFGHQDDLAYGVNWRYQPGRSDVKEVAGDYPAVYGWELGNLEHGLPYNLDSVPFDKMKAFIREGYERGGVITLSWHLDNPLNGESAWDTTHGGVAAALPGGARHELYNTWLDRLASFLSDLKTSNGTPIPVLFRPYHELTGNWFWWCKNTCTPAEFKLLWRYTVDYLRQEKSLHNMLLVYNTADFSSKEDFLQYYPGDDVVDVVSFDSYMHGNADDFIRNIDAKLSVLETIATEKNKIPAFAETGYEAIPDAQWWTNVLWKAIAPHKISYVLVWRNHGLQPNGNMHYYGPYKGHPSAPDFIRFYQHPKTLFEKDIAREKLYEQK